LGRRFGEGNLGHEVKVGRSGGDKGPVDRKRLFKQKGIVSKIEKEIQKQGQKEGSPVTQSKGISLIVHKRLEARGGGESESDH